ncbi:putative selenate ABC transporter substrate-binding protein [Actinokineospora sp.]|uniref:putative selenate ABC transporter substrate-binding protein n=1 Tax=Actinokineospora sp. TaxID=1872133 RepID=UPI004037B5FE
MLRTVRRAAVLLLPALALVACGTAPGDVRGDAGDRVLSISAIPDQDPEKLQRLYGTVSEYLSDELGVKVRYVPVTDYTASVVAFERGDLDLVFFGGLTGVQARDRVPGALPIAQRDIDAKFRSVFIANTTSGIEPIADVAGLKSLAGQSFTFGSDSSTSGRLMPQHFLAQAGVSVDDFAGKAGFSGSHDTTAKLVEAGTYRAGVLNAAVWDDRVKSGKIDGTKVREVFRTPTYHDYHWLIRPDVDAEFGAGFTQRVSDTLLGMSAADERARVILDLFQAKQFVATKPANYDQIEVVARASGLLR